MQGQKGAREKDIGSINEVQEGQGSSQGSHCVPGGVEGILTHCLLCLDAHGWFAQHG